MTWPFHPLDPGSYGTVCVDPPWNHGITQRLAGGANRRQNAAWRRYSTLTIAELSDLPVADLLAGSGHVWLWVTNTMLARGDHAPILDAWGLRPILPVTWCKTGQPGLGRYVRNTTESCVLAVKGWGSLPAVPAPSTWFTAARAGHSVKPLAFGDLVEQVSPGPYCELFQRQGRLGWVGWGWGHESGAA